MTSAPDASDCAAALRDRFQFDHTPKTSDLLKIVRHFGATISHTSGGAIQGAVEQVPDCLPMSWQVSIDETMPSYRFRFVLSHELGHLYLRQSGLAPRSEERWCNEFAAELLMPHACIRNEYENASSNLASVRDLARRYDVSRSAALVRLRRVLSWQRGMIGLRLRGNELSVARMTAIPSVALYQLDPMSTTDFILGRGTAFQTWLTFSFRNEIIEIFSECERRNTWIDAFINTRDLARICTQIVRETSQPQQSSCSQGRACS